MAVDNFAGCISSPTGGGRFAEGGTWIPGRLCAGIRPLPEGQDFALVRAGGPVLCVELRRCALFSRLAISVPDPERVMRVLLPLVPRGRLGT
jgi:hypothetical protein